MADDAPREQIEITEIVQLIDLVELSEVMYYELSAVRSELPVEPDLDELIPQHALKLGFSDEGLEVRLRTDLSTKYGDIHADAAVRYKTRADEHHLVIPGDIALDFANRVGIMALLPYLREAISSLSLKVFGDPILMPIIRANELTFLPSEEDLPDEEDS